MVSADHRAVQFVVKVSKFCNLRCRYCYEYEELNDREIITQPHLTQMYQHIADYYQTFDSSVDQPVDIEFIWHGGEPLVISPDFYWQTFDQQDQIFGHLPFHISNTVQTNLTLLDSERIRLLSEGFDKVGVSLDLFGGLRVNGSGMDSQLKVLKNLDILRAQHIDFGCITVLTQLNIHRIQEMMRFYERLKISSVRFLPLFKGAFEGQHQGYEITNEEVVEAFKGLVDLVLTSNSAINIEPISTYIKQIIHHYTPAAKPAFYSKREWETVYVVNTNGDIFSDGDPYEPEFCYGNLFTTPLSDIIHSPVHQAVIDAAEQQTASVCNSCRFYGSCSGFSIAENHQAQGQESEEQLDSYNQPQCPIDAPMLAFVERRLKALGIINPVTNRLMSPASAAQSTAQSAAQPVAQPLPAYSSETSVRLYCYAPDSLTSRIQYSTGICKASTLPQVSSTYISAAYVPVEPWRELTPHEAESLCAPHLLSDLSQWQLGSDLGIIRLTEDVISPFIEIFEEYGTRHHLSQENYRTHTTHPRWEKTLADVRAELERYSLQGLAPEILSLASAPPGLRTVTQEKMNPFEREFVGLHLDSWDKKPLRRRHQSRNRICINLGREDRHFLFIPLTQVQMFQMIGLSDPEDIYRDYRGLHIGQKFMERFPDYPVAKLRIAPGEAYIAPTDNMIHDATSIGKRYPDVALHITGHFGFSVQQVAPHRVLVGGRV